MKVDSNYPTLLLGVSQQAPVARLPGQHEEQVNMIPDPVEGLTRRPGSLLEATADGAPTDVDLSTMRSHEFTYGGKDYILSAPQVEYGAMAQPFLIYNLTDKHFVSVVYDPADPGVQTLMASGLSAIASVGKYIFAASVDGRMGVDTTTLWSDSADDVFGKAALWVRAGAYSRTIKVTVTNADDSTTEFSYTTPSSAYGGVLDTSGVPVFAADPAGGTQADSEAAYVPEYPAGSGTGRHELNWADWTPTALSVKRGVTTLTNVHPAAPSGVNQYAWDSANPRFVLFDFFDPVVPLTISYTHAKTVANPNYTKTVSDITNEYNTALTQWIVTSATAIQPGAVAAELLDLAIDAGLTAVRVDGHVFFEGVKNVVVDDGGDGSLVLAVGNNVQDVASLTRKHFVGKVVRVRPLSSAEAFYMQAIPKTAGDTGYTDVQWVEGAQYKHQLRDGLIYATLANGRLYVASSATRLNDILPGTHPEYAPSTCGDNDTSPLPYFIGKQITYLGMFQDRLLIGAGAVIRASKTSEYLTFFRQSVLTLPADDALEVLSHGAEDDVLRYSALYDKTLVLFGKKQYTLSGSIPLTPTSAIMPVLSSHVGSDAVQPLAAGGFIFYCKQNEAGTSAHQLQPGRNSEQAESFPISAQLANYVPPTPLGLAAVPDPALLLIRTGHPQNVYVYKYLDTPEGRAQGAWYKWTYSAECGRLLAVSSRDDGVALLWHRGDKWVMDKQPLDLQVRQYPYLDSMAPYGAAEQTYTHVAYNADVTHFMFGSPAENEAELIEAFGTDALMQGFEFPAYFTPSPVYARDRQGKARLTGRTVVTFVAVKTKDSAGFIATLYDAERDETIVQDYNAEIEGEADPDVVSITSERIPVSVGAGNEAYSLTIAARQWLPLTISALDWTGQYFNRTPGI